MSLNLCLGAAYDYCMYLTPLQREIGRTRPELSVPFTFSIAFLVVDAPVRGR